MALTQAQRIQISGELLDLPLKVASAAATQAQLAGVKTDLLNKDNSVKIFFDKYNSIIDAYQNERRWVNGTTYSNIVESDVVNAAQRLPGNKFFPADGSWVNFQPKLHPSALGNPTSTSINSEIEIFTKSGKDGGLLILLDFLLNGQTSVLDEDSLTSDYEPGSGSMQVSSGGQTQGKLIIVEGGGFSGLFLIDEVSGTSLTVTEIVAPDGTLPELTSKVNENIIPFNNSERNTLTSAKYQNVISTIATQIINCVLLWETAIDNEIIQLNLNTDNRSPQATEITNAKNDINDAKSIIDSWQTLPDTGTTGSDSKFVDVNIASLQTEVSDRTAFSTTRNSQIITALGTASQALNGTLTGSGMYFERIKQIDSRINAAGGPLTEYYEKSMADLALTQISNTAINTQATYETELKTEKFAADGNGSNIITVNSVTNFSIGNTIFIVSDTQPELTGTITGISGTNIELSFTVSNLYKTGERARIYKQL